MFSEIQKNITTVEIGTILHGVNVSGYAYNSGVAGAIRKKWPHAYESYKEHGSGERLLGTVQILFNVHDDITIINGYTQVNFGSDGQRYADPVAVEKCIRVGLEYYEAFKKDLYLPKIGCGLGGLSWEDDVKPIILNTSEDFPGINIYVCDL